MPGSSSLAWSCRREVTRVADERKECRIFSNIVANVHVAPFRFLEAGPLVIRDFQLAGYLEDLEVSLKFWISRLWLADGIQNCLNWSFQGQDLAKCWVVSFGTKAAFSPSLASKRKCQKLRRCRKWKLPLARTKLNLRIETFDTALKFFGHHKNYLLQLWAIIVDLSSQNFYSLSPLITVWL